MANWDGPCFGGDKQNNYFPSGYGVSNVQPFSGASADWTCYPVSVTLPQTPLDGFQQLNASALTNDSFQPIFSLPFPSSHLYQNFRGTDTNGGYYVEKVNTNSPHEKDLEMAATSSLTPTAGEFIPRPIAAQLDSKLGRSAKEADSNCRKAPEIFTPLTSSPYSSSDQGNHLFRRHGGNDSKYFHSSRNPSTGSVHDAFYSNRRGNARAVLQSTFTNSKLYNMEKAKNQDRQRLLAEAAAFLTPSGNSDVTPASDGDSNLHADARQQNMNFTCRPKGKGEFSRAFMQPNKPIGDTSNVRFKNCGPRQQDNFSHPKRRNGGFHSQFNQGGFHDRNLFVSESGNGSALNHQLQFADCSNGSNYRGIGASHHASPKKEADHYRGYTGNYRSLVQEVYSISTFAYQAHIETICYVKVYKY